MSIGKWYISVMACVVITLQAWGQVANSPFTQFGVGQRYSNALANNQGMGGVGVSQPQYWYVNNQNPALLVYNTITCIQAGVLVESVKINDGVTTEKHRAGNMNYLVMAFPIKPLKWTTSIGLMPYSSLNYNVKFSSDIEGKQDKIQATAQGTGGLTQLFWSNGVRINDNFSVGLKANYIFGYLDEITKRPFGYVAATEDKNIVKGFAFSLGGSYSKDSLWGKDYRLSIGTVYEFASSPHALLKNKISTLSSLGDTLQSTIFSRTNGNLHLPASITAGISLSKTNWTVSTEFNYQDWTTFRSVNTKEEDGAGKSWRVSLGGEITPDQFAPENILKRLTYRMGGSIEQYAFSPNQNPVKDLGFNFGLSIPAGRSSVDLGFKIGKLGNVTQNILEQNYFKLFFGITFNDKWFIKRKFD